MSVNNKAAPVRLPAHNMREVVHFDLTEHVMKEYRKIFALSLRLVATARRLFVGVIMVDWLNRRSSGSIRVGI